MSTALALKVRVGCGYLVNRFSEFAARYELADPCLKLGINNCRLRESHCSIEGGK